MKSWIVASIGGGGVAAIATLVAARIVWSANIRELVSTMQPADDGSTRPYGREDLAGLPEAVIRYFDFALTPGQSLVRTATIRQRGAMALRPGVWSPFAATEYFATVPPGFVWDARISMARIFTISIRDGYVRGCGAILGKIAALVPVVDRADAGAMAEAECLRYLAECVYIPTALLPRSGVSWISTGDDSARATLSDGSVTVHCDMRFRRETGEICEISAIRGRDADGTLVPTLWIGRWSEYSRVGAMMIPLFGDVAWALPTGTTPYWKGRVEDARFTFFRAPT